MNDKIVCRVLTGPTASGKSGLAVRMARENSWEIICMDSMQIYRGMDIGTAKPDRAEQEAVRHHMLNICDPRDEYSVSRYAEDAERTAAEIAGRGKGVLFVGGTGLYLEGMIRGMSMGNVPADESLRQELHMLAETVKGKRLLDERLRRIDPETAERLPLNDLRRRIRAIEVSEATGIPFSRQRKNIPESPFRWIIVSTFTEREKLYGQINRRVDRMIASGLPAEVERLLGEGVPEGAQSMQAIGYKEMIPYLRGAYSLETAADEIRKGTRHYAKRQITFLKRIKEIQYVNTEDPDAYGQIMRVFREGEEEKE